MSRAITKMASHSVDNIDDIVDRVVARHAGETKACRVLSPRFETAERDFDSCEFAREGEILKRRARWGDFQVAIARAGENYEERHSASRHPGVPSIDNICPGVSTSYSRITRPAPKEFFYGIHYRGKRCRRERRPLCAGRRREKTISGY